MLDFNKYDKFNQVLKPGDVCIRQVKDKHNRTVEFCVYKEEVRNGKTKGTYGRFITPGGVRSIKYTSVIFVFDTVNEARARTPEIQKITREYYEGVKK